MHFGDRKVRDYRSAHMNANEAKRMAAFTMALLDRGILAPGGLFAFSTPMTSSDVDIIVHAVADSIAATAMMR
jgi:glutamate-1-semialdehyde 2,1-aminomutase